MKPALPPLSSLRAFVAVARLGSVVAAAEELHVTHSAVSHQIRALEDYLGVALVSRTGRRTALTNEGRIYAYQIRQALDNVAAATARLRQQRGGQVLRVSVLPSFAMHWLVPRLPDWRARHPALALSLEASTSLTDFDNELADCSIRFGHGQWPNLHSHRLMGDTLLLVASPRLFPSGAPRTVMDALSVPTLQATESWSLWLSDADEFRAVEIPNPVVQFTDSTHMLEAARIGMGVALTRRSIATGLLARGELMQVTEIETPHTSSYYLVWPHRSHQSPTLEHFKVWLDEQTQRITP